jgi:hypothetical protein
MTPSLKTIRFKPIAFLGAFFFCSMSIGAMIGIQWSKSEVTPVILVKPGIGGYVPTEGNSIGSVWTKKEIKPVLLLKPDVFGFVPREGNTIGEIWSKNDVIPVVLTEPTTSGFIPSHLLSDNYNGGVISSSPVAASDGARSPSTPSVIESQIDGDFNGWSGDTIFKLTNGQIWEQSEYAYEYEYAYRPDVTIYRTSGGYKMKVADMSDSIAVKRIK